LEPKPGVSTLYGSIMVDEWRQESSIMEHAIINDHSDFIELHPVAAVVGNGPLDSEPTKI